MKRIVEAIRARLDRKAQARRTLERVLASLEMHVMERDAVTFLVPPERMSRTEYRGFGQWLRAQTQRIRERHGWVGKGDVVLVPPGFDVTVLSEHGRKVRDSILAEHAPHLLDPAPFGGPIEAPPHMADAADFFTGVDPQWVELRQALGKLFVAARKLGIAVTIENRPLEPLAMGNHYHAVSVRPLREKPLSPTAAAYLQRMDDQVLRDLRAEEVQS
ncbi:UNVERIFIED_CONTAM: hypothetical protein OHV15_19025 [Microbacterium sp. SLM126]